MIVFVLGALAIALPGNSGSSSPLSACSSLRSSAIVAAMGGLPQSIQGQVKRMVPDLAPAGAKCQRGDVIEQAGLPTRRFVGAVEGRYSWVVTYEHSQGSVHHFHAITFGRAAASDYAPVPHGVLTGPLCQIADAALSGALSADHL